MTQPVELDHETDATRWMTGRVLLIGRETDVADALRGEGLRVESTVHGRAAIDAARSGRFALLVIDVLTPGLGGYEGCRRVRNASDIPFLILTARDSSADRVLGLEAGADDCMCEPFSMAELVSRVRAILRRRSLDLGATVPVRRIGDLVIDFAAHRVTLADRQVCLTPTEFRLLALLGLQPGQAFSPQQILRHVWRSDYVGDDGACKAHVSNLRHKIELDPRRPRRLVTIRGVGYALRAEG